jgi:hypothetical protein
MRETLCKTIHYIIVGDVGALLAVCVAQIANAAGRIELRFFLFVGYVGYYFD